MAVKKSDRRKQLRQKQAERSLPWWQRLREDVGIAPILAGVALCVASSVIALYGETAHRHQVGKLIDQPIYAVVGFTVTDEQETLRRQQAARAAAPSHYRVNDALTTKVVSELQNIYQAAQAAETFEAFEESAKAATWKVDAEVYERLRKYAEEKETRRFETSIDRLREALRRETTWRGPDAAQRTPPSSARRIIVHDPSADADPVSSTRDVDVFELTPISNRTSLARAAADLAGAKALFARELRPTVEQILIDTMSVEPSLVFDSARTTEEMSRAQESVEPATVQYRAAEPLIPPGRTLTAADVQLLDRHQTEYAAYLQSDAPAAKDLREQRVLQRIGYAVVFFLLALGMIVYIGRYQPRIFKVRARIAAFVALAITTLLVARFIDARIQVRELIYTPPLFAAAVLALAYSRRFALGATAVLAIMVILCVRGDLAMFVTMLVGAGAIVNMLNEIRTRTRLLWVGAASAGSIFITAGAFGLINGQSMHFASVSAVWAAAAALLAAMLLQTLLPLIERAFKIATSLTLLEWKDPTKPLLQRLAQEAPGTYAHSLALGEMASAACNAIGANGLLAQVGALYHDIGKLNKPEYFTENQKAQINRHDNLAPTMSLLIIIGHVKDGVELAKEYRLPRVLHPFIEEHHGTTVVRYFHHIASEKQAQAASGKHDREVPEARFRYPGPKPKTRESAILMICDGTEGAVRSLAEPTAGRIEQTVHQIVTSRLNDGQFDDCDITLRELRAVEDSLVKSLCSQYHGRVAYPKRGKTESQAAHEEEKEPKPIAG